MFSKHVGIIDCEEREIFVDCVKINKAISYPHNIMMLTEIILVVPCNLIFNAYEQEKETHMDMAPRPRAFSDLIGIYRHPSQISRLIWTEYTFYTTNIINNLFFVRILNVEWQKVIHICTDLKINFSLNTKMHSLTI